MNIIRKIIEKKNNITGADPVTIAFFGDSVTQGCFELYKTGERSFETEFRVEEGYHTKFRDILQMLYPNVPINMIYAGISGDNTASALKRVERDVCAFNPDLTVFCFGLNDCCSGMNNLENYKNAIKGIIAKLKKCGTEIIFMTPNLMADSVSDEVTDSYIREIYADMIKSSENSLGKYIEEAKEICREENVPVCDCFGIWQTLKENEVDITRLLSNRINHPIEKMYWLFAIKLIETIFKEETK